MGTGRVDAMAHLEIFKKGTKASEFQLDASETVIGRDAGVQVRLDDPSVSRRHARIITQDGAWVVEDLNTKNGTFVNGQREYRRPLKDGDGLEFGSYVLRFRTQKGEAVPAFDASELKRPSGERPGLRKPTFDTTKNIDPKQLAKVREEARNSLQPHFVEYQGTTPRILVLRKDKVTLGAGDDADLKVKELGKDVVAEVAKEEAGFVLHRVGFFTTLKVNGEKVKDHVLADGDRVECGTAVLVFRAGAAG